MAKAALVQLRKDAPAAAARSKAFPVGPRCGRRPGSAKQQQRQPELPERRTFWPSPQTLCMARAR
eukprot:15327964-Alexandrium_andersonii.AAC.1